MGRQFETKHIALDNFSSAKSHPDSTVNPPVNNCFTIRKIYGLILTKAAYSTAFTVRQQSILIKHLVVCVYVCYLCSEANRSPSIMKFRL